MNETTHATPRILLSGRYELQEKLGEGGMGVVHKAWDCNLKTEVVIKIPHPNAGAAKQFAERFALEVQSLVRLRHPHVVGILDVGEHQGLPFAVLQYLSGGSLKDRGAKDLTGKTLPTAPGSLRNWLAEVAGALDFVHAQGFVHRDVKPDNILFDSHGNVYLSDFGIAKVLAALAAEDAAQHITRTGTLVGTPPYMPPEQLNAQRCDGRSDQYALGVTVYELLAGKNPFFHLDLIGMGIKKMKNEVPPLHIANPSVPRAVSGMLQRSMLADPAGRYPSCGEFARALLAVCGGGPVPPRPAPPPLPTPLSCPGCGHSIPLTQSLFGKKVTCYKCRRELTVSGDGRHLTPAPGPVSPPLRPAPPPLPKPPGETVPIAGNNTDPRVPIPPRPAPPPLPGGTGQTVPLSLDDDTEPLLPPKSPAKRSRMLLLAGVVVLAALAVGLAIYRFWPTGSVTRDDVVTGTIEIDFKTRQKDAPPDAVDTYAVNLVVRTEDELQVRYSGKIHRRPPVKGDKPVPGWLQFDLTVASEGVGAGAEKPKLVGKITGVVPQSTTGLYTFKTLRWTNDAGAATEFGGEVQGKRGDEREKKPIDVLVFVGGERVTFPVPNPDPMKFRSLVIPADTGLQLPAAEWTGDLTFDYDDSRYLANNLTCAAGKSSDRISGLVNWEKHPTEYLRGLKAGEYATSARSWYTFNLQFAPATTGDETGNRIRKGEEKKALDTDKSKPTLSGRIEYLDEGPVEKKETDQEASVYPHKSRLTFRLDANRLTPRQIHTFLKMWLLMSGPVNDE